MACKLAVLRKDSGNKKTGDCVAAYDIEKYLGKAVEPKGGMFVVIEVTDCNKEHITIQKLVSDWMLVNPDYKNKNDDPYIYHDQFDRKYYLQPITEGDQFFADLFNNGRVSVKLAKVEEYLRERNG